MVGEAQLFVCDMIWPKNQFKDPVPTKDLVQFLTGIVKACRNCWEIVGNGVRDSIITACGNQG